MTYKLAKQLKEAGYPQANKHYDGKYVFEKVDGMAECAYIPPLHELIEACGGEEPELFLMLHGNKKDWSASMSSNTDIDFKTGEMKSTYFNADGESSLEAIAKLYIALKKKL